MRSWLSGFLIILFFGCAQPAPPLAEPPVLAPGAGCVILLGLGLPPAELEAIAATLRAHPIFGRPDLEWRTRAVSVIDLGLRTEPDTPGPYLELDRRLLLQALDGSGGRGDYAVVLCPGVAGGGTRQDVSVVGLGGPHGRSVLLHELAHLLGGLDEGYEGEGGRVHATGASCLMAEKAAKGFCADCERKLRAALAGGGGGP